MSFPFLLPGGRLVGTVRIPGSKSLTNRALVAAALAPGTSVIRGPLASDDTATLAAALRRLGASIDEGEDAWRVTGPLRPPEGEVVLDVGPAGTPARFLAALAAALPGRTVLDGSPRMRERPMGPLVEALRDLGAPITCLGREGHLPLRIDGGRLRGGEVTIRADVSSQFVSALLLVAPLVRGGLEVKLSGPLVSPAYVTLTREVIAVFAPGGTPRPSAYDVPGDDSAACFPIAGAVVSGGEVRLRGLVRESAQPDAVFRSWAESAGGQLSWRDGDLVVRGPSAGVRPVDADVDPAPDAALPLAALVAFSTGVSRLGGTSRLGEKESDRRAAALELLAACGAAGAAAGDVVTIDGPAGRPRPASFRARDDHRVAMAAGVLALRLPAGSTLDDPGCVSKSWPGFWDAWRQLLAAAPPSS